MNTIDATIPERDPYSRPYISGLKVNNPTMTSHIFVMSNDIVDPPWLPLVTYLGVVTISV